MKNPSLNPLRFLALAALGLGASWPGLAQAQNLSTLFKAASAYDATYQSAQALYSANLAKAEQARAYILPTANLAAGWSRSQFENTVPSVDRSYGTQNATLSASQPLYRPANRASYEQGMKLVEQAQAQLQVAEQDLIVRLALAYFEVLAAQDSLTFIQAQKVAVAEQLASAKRNFEVGTATITDTREAQARYDLVLAQEIAADNELRVKHLALDQLVGQSNTRPSPLALPAALPAPQPQDMNVWVQAAQDGHPGVRQARVALEVARLETVKAQAGNWPTLDLSASYNVTRNQGGGTQTTVDSRNNSASLGLSFNLPLFAGYAIQNRIKETLALEDKAKADLEVAERSVVQATRVAYLGVLSNLGQVKAYEAAEASSQSALAANQLGYQVGVRINIDVLNSQSQLYQTKRDLAKARYDVLIGNLRLRQANGTLKAGDIDAINALLAP